MELRVSIKCEEKVDRSWTSHESNTAEFRRIISVTHFGVIQSAIKYACSNIENSVKPVERERDVKFQSHIASYHVRDFVAAVVRFVTPTTSEIHLDSDFENPLKNVNCYETELRYRKSFYRQQSERGFSISTSYKNHISFRVAGRARNSQLIHELCCLRFSVPTGNKRRAQRKTEVVCVMKF